MHWTELADRHVVGYRVYREEQRGKRVPVGSTFTGGWADPKSEPGRRYRYVVTSYAANGAESAPSAAVEAGAPSVWSGTLPLVVRATR